MEIENGVEKLQQAINESNYIVFFGGAGVSTESGIPDFRSQDGLYNQKYDYPPEEIVSHTFLVHHTEYFYKFYKDKMLAPDALPNAAHKKLAELEQAGKLKAVITQNIDGLHQAAGSKEVLELHGSVLRNYCSKCGKRFDSTDEDVYAGVKYIQAAEGVPKCDECGGTVRPDVVLYEEGLDSYVISRTIDHISRADMLIIGGTSLVVYPAASFINYFNGKHLAVLNMASTGRDSQADIVIHDKIGEVLSKIQVEA
ncbi:NAD-dependent deacetylase [Lachnospiraceae bacterium NE2001]|nr:NAD-dependent deacetylase [Lachnospiraceae bacterium NE2001]